MKNITVLGLLSVLQIVLFMTPVVTHSKDLLYPALILAFIVGLIRQLIDRDKAAGWRAFMIGVYVFAIVYFSISAYGYFHS